MTYVITLVIKDIQLYAKINYAFYTMRDDKIFKRNEKEYLFYIIDFAIYERKSSSEHYIDFVHREIAE